MAYLIKSVFTMLALAAKTQDRRKKNIPTSILVNHQLDRNKNG
ncbi:MAG: hypothetical protein WA191_15760 [Telluria sp.]|nr:hypothetical protein [Telluria sp.]